MTQRPFTRQLLLLWLLTVIVFVIGVAHFQNYLWKVDHSGDNGAYMSAAAAIRRWAPASVEVKQFWGLSYAMAAVTRLTGVSERTALLSISFGCSLASVLLARQLWGGWIAGYFAVLDLEWLQRSYLGGSESLFITLLFGAFWAVRRKRILWGAGLAALASTVRPVGAFALVALGLPLLWKRDFYKFAGCVVLALIIGTLYLLPFWIYHHDPLYQVHRYQAADWETGPAINVPFLAIIKSVVHDHARWTNLLYTLGWVLFVLAGIVMLLRRDGREAMREHPTELIFALLYTAFLFMYNSTHWARSNFPRFAIPVVPFALLGLRKWLPNSRPVLYVLAAVCSVLAAVSAVGIQNIFPALR